MPVECSDLWFWDIDAGRMTFDQGRYVFEIGSSSRDIRGTVSTLMHGQITPALKTVVADCGLSVMRAGDTAQTAVTACLGDDSFIDLSDARVEYSSNNPSVVAVGKDGKLTAGSMRVATITAKVTYKGTAAGKADVAVVGVYERTGAPAMFVSSRGNVWTERRLTYQQGEEFFELTETPLSIRADLEHDEYVLTCTDDVLFFVPPCSHCNRMEYHGSN